MKRAFTKWELLVVLGLLGILAGIFFSIFALARDEEIYKRFSCSAQIRHIGLGFQVYIHDFDGKLPLARHGATGAGWVEQLEPFPKAAVTYQCHIVANRDMIRYPDFYKVQAIHARGDAIRTDYFMNSRLSGLAVSKITSTVRTVLIGDGDDEMIPSSAHYAIASIPQAWLADPASPRRRHMEGSYFGFADGHVKWLHETRTISTVSPSRGSYTFAPR